MVLIYQILLMLEYGTTIPFTMLNYKMDIHTSPVSGVCTGEHMLTLVSIKGTLANSADPDQTPQNSAADQGLHYLDETNGNYSLKYIK